MLYDGKWGPSLGKSWLAVLTINIFSKKRFWHKHAKLGKSDASILPNPFECFDWWNHRKPFGSWFRKKKWKLSSFMCLCLWNIHALTGILLYTNIKRVSCFVPQMHYTVLYDNWDRIKRKYVRCCKFCTLKVSNKLKCLSNI